MSAADAPRARRSMWRRVVRADTVIEAPSERVWELLTDLASYPSWNRFMPRVSGELRPGGILHAEVRFRRGFLGLPFRFQAQVLRCDECREIRWTGTLFFRRLMSGVHSLALEPLELPGPLEPPESPQSFEPLEPPGLLAPPEPPEPPESPRPLEPRGPLEPPGSSSAGVRLVHREELFGLLVPVVGWYLAPRMEEGFREMNEAIRERVTGLPPAML
ncbi:MAG: SRPBCC family protein [Thermoleophilia bacterium]